MEIDTALQELNKLQSFTTCPAECVDSKVLKKSPVDERIQVSYGTSSSTMELDSALHKLGMLSSVTNSRISYLEEKKAKKRRSSDSLSSAPLCVVQMNPDFIKKFSVTKQLSPCVESESEEFEVRKSCRSAWSRRRRDRQDMPYHKRRRLKSIKPVITEYVFIPEKASPLSLSLLDSGNKSNPSSPVKSQSSLTSQGSSLTRSRSLDDLEEIDCPPDCCCPYAAVKADIDTVSQSISQLHVS